MHPFPLMNGWQLRRGPDGGAVEVVDPTGLSRARVVGLRHRRLTAAGRQVLDLHLPDGSRTTLTNGTRRWGGRRARTRGILPLAGTTYVFEHRTSQRARVLRDGVWLATARRGLRGDRVEVRVVLTPDDELATALFVHLLRPGRGSVLGGLADLLGSGT